MDAVQKAETRATRGPRWPRPIAYLLYTEVLRHNPRAPHWPPTDRFFSSAGHAAVLQ